MDFKEYQERAQLTAAYPNIGHNFAYPTLGLAGEAGEVANKIKKIIREQNSEINEENRQQVKAELGDVLWYISQLANEFNLELEDIAANNLLKLKSRLDRDQINGHGDNR